MIIGDPYKFAIITGSINEWNVDDTFCNGVLLMCVNGNLFPKEIVTATLKIDIQFLKKKLMNITVDEELYNMQKDKAFAEIYNITFPEDFEVDNDYRFDISTSSLADNNCFVFAVSNGEQVRIIADKLNYIIEESRHDLDNINVSEAFVMLDELDAIIEKLDVY